MGLIGFRLKRAGEQNWTDYYYRKNLQGDITHILRGSNTVAEYAYDAWGNCTTLTDIDGIGTLNPMRYRGYYYDTETGLYYLKSRYYDPEVGRFINMDNPDYLQPGVLNGLNLYAYCGNNPIAHSDPNGNVIPILLLLGIGALVGAGVGGAVGGITAAANGATGWGIVGGILGGAIMGGAMGAVLAIGGAAGLAALTGISILGFGTGAAFALSVGIGIVAGWASYSIEAGMRSDMQWNLLDFGLAGISGGLQALATFWVGFFGGRLGGFDKIILNPLLKGAATLDMGVTYAFAKAIMGRTVFLTPVAEFLFKLIAISGSSAGIRWVIDKIFKR